MSILSRDAFLKSVPALARKEVSLPSLGGSVYVYELTAGERDKLEAEQLKNKNVNFRARLAIATVRDEAGKPLFSPIDFAAVSEFPSSVLDPIVQAAIEIGKMDPGDIEELEKN